MVLDGREIQRGIVNDLKRLERPRRKFLAVFTAGEDAGMERFIREKEKIAAELDVPLRRYPLPVTSTQDEMRREVFSIARHKTCGGALVQLPLPGHLDWRYVVNVIPPEKDVDVLGERALGAFYTGRGRVPPPSVAVADRLLRLAGITLKTARVAVIGAGFLVGRPVSVWLMDKVAELSVYTKLTEGLSGKLLDADVIISGAGIPGLFTEREVKPGACIIDFGCDVSSGNALGDFAPPAREDITYTPTPGGTGPVLVAQLFENFYALIR